MGIIYGKVAAGRSAFRFLLQNINRFEKEDKIASVRFSFCCSRVFSPTRKAPAPIASPVAAKAKAPKESTKGKVLFVGNLKRNINVQQLAAKFSPFGTVTEMLVSDKLTLLFNVCLEAFCGESMVVEMNLIMIGQVLLECHLAPIPLRSHSLRNRFKEDGFKDIIKDVFLPWFNAFRFLLQNTDRFEKEDKIVYRYDAGRHASKSLTKSLLEFVAKEMKAYQLYTVVPRLTKSIDQLTDWYVHMNRKRIKGEFGVEDNYHELDTLYDVLMAMRLRQLNMENIEGSVHFQMMFTSNRKYFDLPIERAVSRMQAVVEMGSVMRGRRIVPIKYTLTEAKNDFKQVIKVVKVLTDPHIAKQLKLGFFTVLGHRIELTSRPADLAETHHGDARFRQANAAIQLVPRSILRGVNGGGDEPDHDRPGLARMSPSTDSAKEQFSTKSFKLYTIAIAKLIIRAAIFVT
ncbi:isoleucyl tRNA synthetase [Culex quinquefasciatus]|uniref:Isoleucyl tRNA synthetase n=1 Tax=Culex quinquefasciatus TaxID=7176 RepID=B0XGW1_CULQU|nr:isoleucyl tRNA synthetase [Culex quinquefasciatus]|eukprot:XP_001868883.1 isoleucyl tRNA synthetase [Culex quinquefasciatus]